MGKSVKNGLLRDLETSVTVVVGAGDDVGGVVIASGADVHAVVGLDVAAAGVVARDTTLGLLLELPARVLAVGC